jgi:hypothetical protein
MYWQCSTIEGNALVWVDIRGVGQISDDLMGSVSDIEERPKSGIQYSIAPFRFVSLGSHETSFEIANAVVRNESANFVFFDGPKVTRKFW